MIYYKPIGGRELYRRIKEVEDKEKMGFSEKDSMVRVDFFKDTGKWYCTEAIDFHDVYNVDDIIYACRFAIKRHVVNRLSGMTAIILEPYHENSHPIMLKEWDKF